jgi:hypothetical protein
VSRRRLLVTSGKKSGKKEVEKEKKGRMTWQAMKDEIDRR